MTKLILPVKKNISGMTLVEVLVVVLLFSVLFGACFAVILSGSESWQTNSAYIQLTQELRKGMEWMKEDLIETGTSVITDVPVDGNWYNTITFRRINSVTGGNIVWATDTSKFLLGGTNGRQLISRQGVSTDKIIAQDIKTLQIRRPVGSSDIVEVSMTAERTTPRGRVLSAALNFQVRVRN